MGKVKKLLEALREEVHNSTVREILSRFPIDIELKSIVDSRDPAWIKIIVSINGDERNANLSIYPDGSTKLDVLEKDSPYFADADLFDSGLVRIHGCKYDPKTKILDTGYYGADSKKILDLLTSWGLEVESFLFNGKTYSDPVSWASDFDGVYRAHGEEINKELEGDLKHSIPKGYREFTSEEINKVLNTEEVPELNGDDGLVTMPISFSKEDYGGLSCYVSLDELKGKPYYTYKGKGSESFKDIVRMFLSDVGFSNVKLGKYAHYDPWNPSYPIFVKED